MSRFEGRVALVTGGSSGIGRATALRLAQEGATVAVVASSDRARAEKVAAEIESAGGRALPRVADVAEAEAAERLVADVAAELGRVDILVNSAGVYYPTPMGGTQPGDVQRMIDINLRGTFLLMNAVAPRMVEQGGGKIVNIASVAAFVGSRNHSLYSAVKAAVVMLTRAAALELAPHGVHVNAVAPGNTTTPMNEAIRTSPVHAERLAALKASTPSVRKFSDPEDIANIAVFLASEESRAMHGATILADEGRAAGW